jgi:hypothetical protein
MSKLSARQVGLVHDFFVHTADENYMTARWCASNKLYLDFMWLAAHCLEKYMKAVLLVNGKQARQYSHNIGELYSEVEELAFELLPKRLLKSSELQVPYWNDVSPSEFVNHLYRNGNPDNRYLTFGYEYRAQDLLMLDQMVFAIRRLIVSLDTSILPQETPDEVFPSHREILASQRSFYNPMSLPLDKCIGSDEDTSLRRSALNLNMPFAPKGFEHEELDGGVSVRNSPVIYGLLDPLSSENEAVRIGAIRDCEWLLSNVFVSQSGPYGNLKLELTKALADARRK